MPRAHRYRLISAPMTTALEQLADFSARMSLDDVPAPVIERAKLHVLDAITTAVAAVRTPPGEIVAHALDPVDGGGQAHIVATGAQVSVQTAAFVNTQMSVALDLGTNLFFSQGLGGLAVFGPLALAEHAGASGAQLLQAVIAGYEVAGRVALSFPAPLSGQGTERGGRTGPGLRWVALAAGAANAKIRSLDMPRTANTLALVAASVPARPSARWWQGGEVPMAKYGLFGSMAASALAAALLAERGFTGDAQILDDADGFHLAMGLECADPAAMVRDFGKRWLINDAGFKRYPSGTHNQQAIHAMDQLVREHHIAPDRIHAIHVGRAIATSGGFANIAPANDVAAQFSLPFALAAVAHGVPARDWHHRVSDERLRALARRVQLVADAGALRAFAGCSPELQRSPWSLRSRVRIETADGEFERWSEYGDVSSDEVADKFRHHCRGTLAEAQIAEIVETVSTLERIPNVRQLTRCFEA